MRRGSAPAPAISMSSRCYEIFDKICNRRTCIGQNHTRISIILRASEGQSNGQTARELGIRVNTVKSWRKRWIEGYDKLQIFEKGPNEEGVTDQELLQKMLEIIKDRPRSGAPSRITMAQKQQIIAIACDEPEDYGLIMTDWTLEMLAKVSIEKNVVTTISPRYVGTLLKNKQAPTKKIGVLAISKN